MSRCRTALVMRAQRLPANGNASSLQQALKLRFRSARKDRVVFISILPRGLKCIQEIDQVIFLLICEADVEALIVEVHRVEQSGRRAVMEIGRACGQSP